jgi:hypothetical protein
MGGPVLSVLAALMFTVVFGSAAALGLWLYSRFRPITLQTKDAS